MNSPNPPNLFLSDIFNSNINNIIHQVVSSSVHAVTCSTVAIAFQQIVSKPYVTQILEKAINHDISEEASN